MGTCLVPVCVGTPGFGGLPNVLVTGPRMEVEARRKLAAKVGTCGELIDM